MAVFICCADESSDGHQQKSFFFGGFAATVDEWDRNILPAWDERVLAGPPRIDHLHVAPALGHYGDWRKKRGMTWWDAEHRVTEASRVLGCGDLIPIIWSLPYERYKTEIVPYAPIDRHSALEEPDYLAYLSFAFSTLKWLQTYRPEVERVHFWAEEKETVTEHIKGMHDRIATNLVELNAPDLAALVGSFLPVPKDYIQAQAADMLCWHERNASTGRLDTAGWRRRARMIGNKAIYGCNREGHRNDVGDALFNEFVASSVDTQNRPLMDT